MTYCPYCNHTYQTIQKHCETPKHTRNYMKYCLQKQLQNLRKYLKEQTDRVLICKLRTEMKLIMEKINKKHHCNGCKYYTNDKSNFDRHSLSDKHILNSHFESYDISCNLEYDEREIENELETSSQFIY